MTANTPAPTSLGLPIPAGSLVVSCQAPSGSPFRRSELIAAMATAAHLGGASAVRVDGPDDVAAVAAAMPLPVLGINKVGSRDGVYITPTFEAAAAIVRAGAAMVALDGTDRPRPEGTTLEQLVARIHDDLDVPVMADCATLADAAHAAGAGCDVLATTLSGYVGGPASDGPDVRLVGDIADRFDLPVVAEGRYATPDQVSDAFHAGAYAVVVGTAITNPIHITRRFVGVTPLARQSSHS
jgi:N-acylglucosamine-6-phosphate 2-epimerase